MDDSFTESVKTSINYHVNKFADEFIQLVSERVINSGRQILPLRDVVKRNNGENTFIAQNGTFSDLSSLKKKTNFEVVIDPISGHFLLNGALYFKHFEIYYDSFTAKYNNKTYNGKLTIHAGENCINVKVIVQMKNLLQKNVRILDHDFHLADISKLSVKVKGLPFLWNWIISFKIKSYIMEHKSEIINQINDECAKEVAKYVF